jgi:hypothetical protein
MDAGVVYISRWSVREEQHHQARWTKPSKHGIQIHIVRCAKPPATIANTSIPRLIPMGSRRPFDPFSPISPNIIPTKHTISKVSATVDDYQPMYGQQPHYDPGFGSSNELVEALEEDDTDDSFGRRMIRAMNQERVDNARSARPVAFRKARARGAGRLTVENLQRIAPNKGVPSEQRPYSHSSTQSFSSGGGSDPPLNVPRDWGRKSRRSSDWLRRRTVEEQTPKAQDIDWLDAAAEVPLPQVEDSPLSHRGSARGTPASSIRRQNDSLNMIADLELSDELNSASLIASTPAAYTRTTFKNTALDEIRQRELENALEESSIYATARLGDSERQASTQPSQHAKGFRDSLSVRRANPQTTGNVTQTWSHPAEQEIQIPKRTRDITPTTAQGPPSPISLQKASHTIGNVDREVTPQVQKSPKRPEHHRVDSQDILKRLARASSGTPSPGRAAAKAHPAAEQPKEGTSKPANTTRTVQQSKDAAEAIRVRFAKLHPSQSTDAETGPRSAADQSQKESTQDRPEQLARQGTARTSSNAAKPAAVVEETLISNAAPLDPKTPIVTGAWIDTPKTARPLQAFPKGSPRKSAIRNPTSPQKALSTSPVKSVRQGKPSEPSLPSSALAAIVSEARTSFQQNEDALGETTINSLEDLMIHPGAGGDDSVLYIEEDTLDNLQLPATKPTTTAGKLREQEVLQLKSMNEHLRNTQRSLRDVRQGIQRVGNQVGVEGKALSGATSTHTLQAGIAQCDNCNKPAYALWNQAKSLMYTTHNNKTRLTWLGITSLIFLVWLITESTLWYACSQPLTLHLHSLTPTCTSTTPPTSSQAKSPHSILYCRPVFAEHMSGFGVQPEPLEPLFVLPTLLLRPIRPLWRPFLHTVVTFLHWMWGFVTFIFSSDDETVRKSVVQEVVSKHPGIFEDGDWSMMNDEVL